jgi:gamma-glutamyltranspeptidase/glutathione hydrolase
MYSPITRQIIRGGAGRQRAIGAALLCLSLAACGSWGKPIGTVGYVDGFAGMVAADDPNAVMVGRDTLSAGGSAADAAVAMAFTLAVTYPSQASLGGGGTCLVYDHDQGKTEALDFIAPPPGQLLPGTTRPTAVPALPRGLYALHAKYGKLRWEQLVGPAEGMAHLGSPVSRAFARQLAQVAEPLFEDASARRIFANGQGQAVAEGDVLVQSDLGGTLSRLRSRGVGDFYTGVLANEIVAAVKQAGGSLTIEDLRNFLPQWKEPIVVPYGNSTAYFAPPPAAAGLVEAQLWAALARDDAYGSAGTEERPHLLAEFFLKGLADRQRWMNPEGTANEAWATVISKAHLKGLLAGYTPASHEGETAQGDAPADAIAGTGFVAMSSDGSAVACNISLNNPFGIGRVAPGTGILLAAASTFKGRGPYGLGPMLSVNTKSNEFRYAAAAGGGPTAPTAMIQVALETLVDGTPLAQAVADKRLYPVFSPDVVLVEPGYPFVQALQSRAHTVKELRLPGRVNAIKCTSGSPRLSRCSVAADPRGFGLGVPVGGE